MYFDEAKQTQSAGSWRKHPSSRWYDWKGWQFGYEKWSKKKTRVNDWAWEYRDREAQNADWTQWAVVSVPLKDMPKEFVVIAEMRSLWGWDNWSKKPLHGPEIEDRNGEMVALRRDGSVYWKGKWNEIYDKKNGIDKAKDMWIVLYRNLHVFDPENPDTFFTIKLKEPSQSMEWFVTFSQGDAKNSYFFKRISFGEEKDNSNWATQWSIPTYVVGSDLTEEDKANRKAFADIIRDYHAEVDQKSEEEAPKEEAPAYKSPEPDELPF